MWRWKNVLQTPIIGRTLRSDALGKKLVGGNKIRKVNFCLKVDLFLSGIWSWKFFVKTKACVARNFSWWIFRTFCCYFVECFDCSKPNPMHTWTQGKFMFLRAPQVGWVVWSFLCLLNPGNAWADPFSDLRPELEATDALHTMYAKNAFGVRDLFVHSTGFLKQLRFVVFFALVWRLDWLSARNICNSRIPSTNCGHVNAFEFDRALVNSRANFERTRGMNGSCMSVAVRKVQVFFGVFVSSEQTYSSTSMRVPVSRNFVGPRLQT